MAEMLAFIALAMLLVALFALDEDEAHEDARRRNRR